MTRITRALKKPKIRLFVLLSLSAIILALLTDLTFAWLYQNRQREHIVQASNSVLKCDVYFLQSDATRTDGSLYRDPETGYYSVNISNPAAVNYAAKLRVDIVYKGVTRSYLRAYVCDMWVVGGESMLKMDTDFGISGTTWLDNRLYDTYVYYRGVNGDGQGMVYCDSLDGEITIPFIEGLRDIATIYDGEMYLNIRADAVQINRVEAFWGIDGIPH